MDTSKAFPLNMIYSGQYYQGSITPSEDKGKNGMPVFFRVMLGNTFFAYLCCADNGWSEKETGDKPADLINAIGEYIRLHYEVPEEHKS